MIMNLLAQLQTINQYNNAAYAGMQARQSHLGMIRGMRINPGGPDTDVFSKTNFGSMAHIAARDKQLQMTEVQSNFIMSAMDAWQNQLKEQAKNKKN